MRAGGIYASRVLSVRPDIRSLTRDQLVEHLATWDQPAYRVDQLLQWLHLRRAASWDAMTNLPKVMREQ